MTMSHDVAEIIRDNSREKIPSEMSVQAAQDYVLQCVAADLAIYFKTNDRSFDMPAFLKACFGKIEPVQEDR